MFNTSFKTACFAMTCCICVGTVYGFSLKSNSSTKTLPSKEVFVEIPVLNNLTLQIDNSERDIVVKTWDKSLVKIATIVYAEADASLSNAEWMSKLNLQVLNSEDKISLTSGYLNSGGSYTVKGKNHTWSSLASENEGEGYSAILNDYSIVRGNKTITIFVPKTVLVELTNKYSNVYCLQQAGKFKISMTNGNIQINAIQSLDLELKYGNAQINSLQKGVLSLTNANLSMKTGGNIEIESKYGNLNIDAADNIKLESTNDELVCKELGSLSGMKQYGKIKIDKLYKNFQIDGTNVDIKIKEIYPTVKWIKINNKYAQLNIPLKKLKGYTLNYNGTYSNIQGIENKKKYQMPDDCNNCDDKFTATFGDTKSTLAEINCQNCTVFF